MPLAPHLRSKLICAWLSSFDVAYWPGQLDIPGIPVPTTVVPPLPACENQLIPARFTATPYLGNSIEQAVCCPAHYPKSRLCFELAWSLKFPILVDLDAGMYAGHAPLVAQGFVPRPLPYNCTKKPAGGRAHHAEDTEPACGASGCHLTSGVDRMTLSHTRLRLRLHCT